MQDDYASPIFGGWGNEYSLATFYLTCAGDLLPYLCGRPCCPSLHVDARESTGRVGGTYPLTYATSNNVQRNCTQDTAAKTISCGEDGIPMVLSRIMRVVGMMLMRGIGYRCRRRRRCLNAYCVDL
jgi:hypothetical protein